MARKSGVVVAALVSIYKTERNSEKSSQSEELWRRLFIFFSPSLISPQSLIYEKYVYKRIEIITNNLKQLRDMGNLIKGLKVAAYVAEIIVAGSVVIELAEKYSGKFGKKKIATGEVKAVDAATEN